MAPHRRLGLLGRMTRRRSEGQVNVLSSEGHQLHVQQGFEDLQNESQGIKHDKLQHTWKLLAQHKDAAARQKAEAAALVIQRAARAYRRKRRALRLVREFVARLKQAVLSTRAQQQAEHEGVAEQCTGGETDTYIEVDDADSTASDATHSRQSTPRGAHHARRQVSRQRTRTRVPSSSGASMCSPRSVLRLTEADVQLCTGARSRPQTAQQAAVADTVSGSAQPGIADTNWDVEGRQCGDAGLEAELSDTISYVSASTTRTRCEMPGVVKRLGQRGYGLGISGSNITRPSHNDMAFGTASAPCTPPRRQFGSSGLVPVTQPDRGLLELHISHFVCKPTRATAALHPHPRPHPQQRAEAGHANLVPWDTGSQGLGGLGRLTVEGCHVTQHRSASPSGDHRRAATTGSAANPVDLRAASSPTPSLERGCVSGAGALRASWLPSAPHGAPAVGILHGTQLVHGGIDAQSGRLGTADVPYRDTPHRYHPQLAAGHSCDPQSLQIAGTRQGMVLPQCCDGTCQGLLAQTERVAGDSSDNQQQARVIEAQCDVHMPAYSASQTMIRGGCSPARSNGRVLLPTTIVSDPTTGSLVDQSSSSPLPYASALPHTTGQSYAAGLSYTPGHSYTHGRCASPSRASATSISASTAGSLKHVGTTQPVMPGMACRSRSGKLVRLVASPPQIASRYGQTTEQDHIALYSCPQDCGGVSASASIPSHAQAIQAAMSSGNLSNAVSSGSQSEPLYMLSGSHSASLGRRKSSVGGRVSESRSNASPPRQSGINLPRIALSKSAGAALHVGNVQLGIDAAVLPPQQNFMLQPNSDDVDLQNDGYRFLRVL